jgi:hypothetical protein
MAVDTANNLQRERRIERAVRYVSDYWLPVNKKLVSKIKLGLDRGQYEHDRSGLIDQLKKDVGLFTDCVRSLMEMVKNGELQVYAQLTPIEILEQAELEQLRTILQSTIDRSEIHKLEQGENWQVARFEESLLSASTVEVLAEDSAVDSDYAYSAALLRQLGYTLIAWNYPTIYKQALAALKSGTEFDLFIVQKLGFSPGLLAERVLRAWGMPSDLIDQMGIVDPFRAERQENTDSVGVTLDKLCRVGEALARANFPDTYPTAQDDWQVAKLEIESHLGGDGLKRVWERFEDACDQYRAAVPQLFQPGLLLELEVAKSVTPGEFNLRGNPYLFACEQHVRDALLVHYSRFGNGDKGQNHIRHLIKNTVPIAGFKGGIIYTVDPTMMMLVPQVKIDEPRAHRYEAVDYSVVRSNTDIVAVAYQGHEPIVKYVTDGTGKTQTAIAGLFGMGQKLGVLYLEIPEVISDAGDSLPLTHFRAMSFALTHTLMQAT